MDDTVEYRSPFGFIGSLADRAFLQRYMRRLLERRNASIEQVAERAQD